MICTKYLSLSLSREKHHRLQIHLKANSHIYFQIGRRLYNLLVWWASDRFGILPVTLFLCMHLANIQIISAQSLFCLFLVVTYHNSSEKPLWSWLQLSSRQLFDALLLMRTSKILGKIWGMTDFVSSNANISSWCLIDSVAF